MRFIREIENKSKMGRIGNITHRMNLEAKALQEKIEANQLRWYGHVKRFPLCLLI